LPVLALLVARWRAPRRFTMVLPILVHHVCRWLGRFILIASLVRSDDHDDLAAKSRRRKSFKQLLERSAYNALRPGSGIDDHRADASGHGVRQYGEQ